MEQPQCVNAAAGGRDKVQAPQPLGLWKVSGHLSDRISTVILREVLIEDLPHLILAGMSVVDVRAGCRPDPVLKMVIVII